MGGIEPEEQVVEVVSWPKISIVTPSYNQGQFLEAAIRSVVLQKYPNLEYIVIDGGSTDNSLEVIEEYHPLLTYWVSEKDNGHYDAVNKGFARSTGEIMAWLNSSDMYCPWTFTAVAQVFMENPNVDWITTMYPIRWDADGTIFSANRFHGYSREAFYEGRYGGSRRKRFLIQYIMQEATFWRRPLWQSVGGKFDTKYAFAADFDLWARFYERSQLYGVGVPLGGNRIHKDPRNYDSCYFRECFDVLARYQQRDMRWLRSAMRALRLHEIPWIRVMSSKLIGYELHSVMANSKNFKTSWEVLVKKVLI
jgi:glycosyltransferase involved in cell wall biosynthesis